MHENWRVILNLFSNLLGISTWSWKTLKASMSICVGSDFEIR